MTLRIEIPQAWQRLGLVLRGDDGGPGGFVVGDPCVVRDEDAGLWRMFLFLLPPGHGHATTSGDLADPASWKLEGPLTLRNPREIDRGAFKPFVVLDASRPGHAARIDGRYCLLFVADHEAKVVRRAWSESLAGPWTIEAGVLIERGGASDFDAKHVDAVSAWLFPDRGEILYFYMGYPSVAQQPATSALGSSQGVAVESMASARACAASALGATPAAAASDLRKLGCILRPSERRGHWASGWVGGLQLLPGRSHRWIGLVNASPTPPREDDTSMSREEPPPSLGGFAVCDEAFPVSGWRWCDAPIEWATDVPAPCREAGEEVNFWRHFAVPLEDGRLALFYNAGDYFREKLFLRVSLPLSSAA